MKRRHTLILGIITGLLECLGISVAQDCTTKMRPHCPYIRERHIEHYNPATPSSDRAFPYHMTAAYNIWPGVPASLRVRYPGQSGLTENVVSTSSNPGFVYSEPGTTRRVQFAILSREIPDQPGSGTETAKDYKIYYRLSHDGGQHYDDFRPVIQSGAAYTALHPLTGVVIGTNGATVTGLGHINRASDGTILVPIAIWPLDPACASTPERCRAYAPKYHVTTYTEAYALLGTWTPDGTDLKWALSQPAKISEEQSTRGTVEPALIELKAPGSCILIARGSNQGKPGQPSYYWLFRSADGCRTWDGPAQPWGYSDGTPFMSPAAPSALYRSSKNRPRSRLRR